MATDIIQGKRATVKVGLTLKGERQQVLNFDLFCYRPGVKVYALVDPYYLADLSRAEKAEYLVFLKRTPDGTLIPTSGHYQASESLREVTPGLISKEVPSNGQPQRPPAADRLR